MLGDDGIGAAMAPGLVHRLGSSGRWAARQAQGAAVLPLPSPSVGSLLTGSAAKAARAAAA